MRKVSPVLRQHLSDGHILRRLLYRNAARKKERITGRYSASLYPVLRALLSLSQLEDVFSEMLKLSRAWQALLSLSHLQEHVVEVLKLSRVLMQWTPGCTTEGRWRVHVAGNIILLVTYVVAGATRPTLVSALLYTLEIERSFAISWLRILRGAMGLVWNTYELREMVFARLPLLDLYVAKSIAPVWRQHLADSHALQRLMYRRATKKEPDMRYYSSTLAPNVCLSAATVEINPVLLKRAIVMPRHGSIAKYATLDVLRPLPDRACATTAASDLVENVLECKPHSSCVLAVRITLVAILRLSKWTLEKVCLASN